MDYISFEEFKKIDLRVGRIKSAERIPNSEKLLKLLVDICSEKRQIIAGIGKAYEPNFLVDKNIIIVTNLAPRKLMGEESHGMLLAASDEVPVLLIPERDVPPGSQIK